MSARRLQSSPAILPIYGRALLGALPGAGHLPFVSGGGGEMPDLAVELEGAGIDHDRLADYCGVCGFTLRDELPPTYPHILAFPLHMALVTDSSFPFPAMGLVHLENSITRHRAIGIGEKLDLHASVGALEPHPKGRTFPLITTARSGGELVWESRSVTLHRGGGSGDAEERTPPAEAGARELRVEASWSLPDDLGRRYASVSGDRNPIHLYGLTAKAFGFPRQIAHGMWTKARCLAALEARLPGAFTVDVAFKRPLLLPSTVEFLTSGRADGDIAFEVRSARDGSPHLRGVVSR